MILLVTGRRGLHGAWPLAVVGSLSFILGQLPASQGLGPYLPDIIGAVVCFGALLLLLRFWRPRETLGFGGVPVAEEKINSSRTNGLFMLGYLILIALFYRGVLPAAMQP